MKVHQLPGYIQSIYLIEYTHGLLLLDGCCRADVWQIIDFIEQDLKRNKSDLKLILVTHMHPDHAGAAHKLRKITGCQIASANKDNHWYRGVNGVLMHWIDVVLTLYVGRRMNKPYKYVAFSRKLKPNLKLNEGDLVPGFEDWQILETPGHTDRDLSIWHPQKNMIYVADLFIKLRQRFIHPFPVFHPNKYKRSLQKIRDLKPDQVLLAHGGQLHVEPATFNSLINHSPKIPRTPLRASIIKIKKVLGRKKKP